MIPKNFASVVAWIRSPSRTMEWSAGLIRLRVKMMSCVFGMERERPIELKYWLMRVRFSCRMRRHASRSLEEV